ncbi:MAG: FecR domain-containing protein [Bacteroidota bacterium]
MKNQYQTVEDFVADESFQDFCLRPDHANRAKWTQYLVDHPEQAALVREARMLVQMLHVPAEAVSDSATVVAPRKRKRSWVGWAAAILLLLGATAGIFYYSNRPTGPIAIQQEKMSLTAAEDRMGYTLPDQSTVLLRKGATLSWMTPWGKNSTREVWLEGEAFFDVRHDPLIGQQEFDVILPEGRIQVLGTSFLVKPAQEDLNIFLADGKIAYHSKGSTYNMKPGDHLKQTATSFNIQHNVDVKEYMLWKVSGISFSGESISEVVRQLNRSFDLDIRIGNKRLKSKKISASIAQNDPQLLLEAIALIYNIKIIHQGDQIILK